MRRALLIRSGRHVHIPIALRPAAILLVLLSLLIILAFAALDLGSTPLPAGELLRWLAPFIDATRETDAVLLLRWPRVAVAILGGAMIAASGHLLQIVSRNGLADPGLLGISQGTMAAVVLGAAVLGIPPQWLAPAGLVGGLATAILVLSLAYRLASTTGLILVGLAVSIVLGALIEIVMVQGGMAQFARWLAWSHGSLTAVSAENARMVAIWALPLIVLTLLVARSATPLLLGREQAAAIGAAPQKLALLLTLLSAALVAPIVAVVGPISFLGLIAAHVARKLVGERPQEALPVSMACGALLLLVADTAGRTLFLPLVVPAGILVSVAGVATFLIAARFTSSRR
ncbi:FecCD family ABC transporter permease [Neorhizobium alkalisoli]|uniref:Iron complex transport system permease protein n=1 Tax=Neorhizobium alkalisoli TaxID=528178 RepID=A0A561R8W9_9HYPH|nr:iron ABC transporter permease [Neorhizobium alkalisoli]TWF59066.1 iron complex transport system permease protein [Neorhizobium alkalisoli]